MYQNSTHTNYIVICFGWMAVRTAARAIQKGTPASSIKIVIEDEGDLPLYLPDEVNLVDILAYKLISKNHLENWEANKSSFQQFVASNKAERLILLADLDSQECTFALTKFMEGVDPEILKDALLIFITPLLEDSLNWKSALPYFSLVKQLPLRKQIIHQPELIRSHQLEQLTIAKIEQYICTYINNLIEDELVQ